MTANDWPVAQPGAVGTYVGNSCERGGTFWMISWFVDLAKTNLKTNGSLKRAVHGSDRGLPRKMKLSSVFKSESWMLRAACTSIFAEFVWANSAIFTAIGVSTKEVSPRRMMRQNRSSSGVRLFGSGM